MSNGNGTNAFGWPKGSVRALLATTLTIASVVSVLANKWLGIPIEMVERLFTAATIAWIFYFAVKAGKEKPES